MKAFNYFTFVLILLYSALSSAGSFVVDGSNVTSVAGGGMFGMGMPMSCTNCSMASMPEGMYPQFGMGGVLPNVTAGAEGNKTSTPLQTANKTLEKLIKLVPSKTLKDGYKTYMEMVSPESYGDLDAGASNIGLRAYFSNKFNSNGCFKSAAIDFYKDVRTTLKKREVCKYGDSDADSYGCASGRAGLDNLVGKGNKSDLEEGWILRLAMKHAKGNPVAAMELVGMCGHDDTNQGNFVYFDRSQEAIAKNKSDLEKFKQKKMEADAHLKELFKNFDADQEAVYKASAKAQLAAQAVGMVSGEMADKGRISQLICPPQNSDYFVPGSLSDKADISPALKEKIQRIQGEDKKDAFIPAKHYHVYGSALLGCKLAQSGVSEDQAVTIQKQASRLYRGVRMCESVRESLRQRERFAKEFSGIDIEDGDTLQEKALIAWEEHASQKIKCSAMDIISAVSKNTGKTQNDPRGVEVATKCKLVAVFGLPVMKSGERAVVIKKIQQKIAGYDTAKLYNDWYVGGGKIGSLSIPCTDVRNKGPTDLMKPNEGFIGQISKPKGWSDERYAAASKKLATWDVDFEWTVAQHEAGSKFGAKLCSAESAKKNPFDEPSCLSTETFPGMGQGGQMINPNKATKTFSVQ